jgi:hypothetical protein
MRKRPIPRTHIPSLWGQLWRRWRGEETRTVAAVPDAAFDRAEGVGLPLLVLRYPRSGSGRLAADRLEHAYRSLLMVVRPSPLDVYAEILPALPATVVVLLREPGIGSCLGHARPEGTESDFSKNLAAQTGSRVGEIDLCWQLIAKWQPQPLASLAVEASTDHPEDRRYDADLRHGIALLAILFHELEHLAFPDRTETEVRGHSDRFYQQVLTAIEAEKGRIYGMEASPSALP